MSTGDDDYSEYVTLLSYTAPVFNFLLFLTGIPTCYRFARAGGVGSKRPGPFIVGTVCCALWFKYGLIADVTSISQVNGIGLVLHLAYTGCYLNYCGVAARKSLVKVLAAIVVTFCAFLFYLSSLHAGGIEGQENERNVCGLVAACSSVCFAGSSLDALRTVIRERSTQSLQKPFILMVFAVTSQWCLYGKLIGDAFVYYPNVVASIVSLAQLGLFCVYPDQKQPDSASEASKVLLDV